MNDGILSQDEIEALLKGDLAGSTGQASQPSNSGLLLNEIEKDALGEIGNISMGTAATTLSTLLGKKVRITTPQVQTTSKSLLQSQYPLPYLVVQIEYRAGLQGSNIFVIKQEDGAVIADLMMGGTGTPGELNEIALSAVTEAMNQMMGSSTTSLSSMFDKKIDISPPNILVVDFAKEDIGLRLGESYEDIVKISFRMEIEDLIDSEIIQVIPVKAAKEMVANLMGGVEEEPMVSTPVSMPAPQPVMQQASPPVQEISWDTPAATYVPQSDSYLDAQTAGVKKGQVAVQPVQFMNLNPQAMTQEPRNIDLIMDVPLDITVELGKTKKSIREILEWGPGSIIQLDKLAGEPVDLLVNGKLIAKGEVVVIDETYGIRITAIVSPMDRMAKLQ